MLVVTGCAWITYAAEVRSASRRCVPAALRQLCFLLPRLHP